MFWIIPSSPLFCPTLQADADPLPQKDPKMSVISFASCGLNLRLAFFFAEKVTNLRVSFMLIFALTYYRLVWTPTMLDELPLVQEIFSRRGWEAGNMLKHCGFWLGSCIAGMSTSLASCRTCCQAASEFVSVKGIQRCLFCLRFHHIFVGLRSS